MSSITILKVRDLHPQIICPLCSGYFIDATTIVECLHSFCRSCIVRYLENSKCCPICDVQIHKTKPLLNIRPDKTLQDIVFKLVPGLFEDEMLRRRQFYTEHADFEPPDHEENGKATNHHCRVYSSGDKINVAISPCTKRLPTTNGDYRCMDADVKKKRYFYCPAMVTVGHLKHLLKSKLSTSGDCSVKIELYWKNIQLPDSYTLLDIGYTYPWDRSKPMELTYSIVDPSVDMTFSAPFSHYAMWKLKRRKHKRRKVSLAANGESDDPDGVERTKKKRSRRHSNISDVPPGPSDPSVPSSSPAICDNEEPAAVSSGYSTEEPSTSNKPSPSPRRPASSSEDDAKENKAVEEKEVEKQPPTEIPAPSEPTVAPLRPENASTCDTEYEQTCPVTKAGPLPPEAAKLAETDSIELIAALPKIPCPVAYPAEKMAAKRAATPKIETPQPARDLRKRSKRCLTPVVQNGVVESEREELRSEPYIGAFPPSSPLFPWGMPPWSQYYSRHVGLNGSYGSPPLPMVPSPLSLSPSMLSSSPSFLTPSASSSTSSGLLNHSYHFPPSSPVPPISPFASPHAPLGSPITSSSNFPTSSSTTWGSSPSLSSMSSSTMDYRQYHQHLHHHLHYPPPQQSLASPRSSWDPVESMFDMSMARSQMLDRFLKSSGVNGSAYPISPGSSHHLSFAMSASASSFSPPIPFTPFRPASTPSFFPTPSFLPPNPSFERELPKP